MRQLWRVWVPLGFVVTSSSALAAQRPRLAIGEFTAGLARTFIDLAWGLYLPANSGIGGL